MSVKKNVAVLCSNYYPIMGGPATCIDKYVSSLSESYNFYIITRNDSIKEPKSDKYNIIYFSSLRHLVITRCKYNITHHSFTFFSKLLLLLINAFLLFQIQYAFPDANRWEINANYEKLKELNKNVGIDVVIAVSNTFYDQLAMLKFKKEYPSIKWICFITDPYAENYIYYKYKLFKGLWKRANLKKEQDIYNVCDYVMVTTEMFIYIPKAFRIKRNKLFPIQFTLDPQMEGFSNPSMNSKVCKLIFAGTLYMKIRNPEFFLSVISKVKDVSLDLFVRKGECEQIINRYAKDNIHREYFVDKAKYIDMLKYGYDVLVNIGNVSTLQAPSKMLELLSTGKPIINFYFTEDTQFNMIEKYPLGLNIKNGDLDAVRKIENFCHEMKGKRMTFKEVEVLFPDNNIDSQVGLLKRLIEF